jgi:hypothetical protein
LLLLLLAPLAVERLQQQLAAGHPASGGILASSGSCPSGSSQQHRALICRQAQVGGPKNAILWCSHRSGNASPVSNRLLLQMLLLTLVGRQQ